jgi:hypothetical protein
MIDRLLLPTASLKLPLKFQAAATLLVSVDCTTAVKVDLPSRLLAIVGTIVKVPLPSSPPVISSDREFCAPI